MRAVQSRQRRSPLWVFDGGRSSIHRPSLALSHGPCCVTVSSATVPFVEATTRHNKLTPTAATNCSAPPAPLDYSSPSLSTYMERRLAASQLPAHSRSKKLKLRSYAWSARASVKSLYSASRVQHSAFAVAASSHDNSTYR